MSLLSATSASRPLVVVAEDGTAGPTMVGLMLGSLGFDVILAADGLDALDAVLTYGPDAVVSDMDMPRLDGLGLCRALRALRVNKTLPIIMYACNDLADPRLRAVCALHGAQVISRSLAAADIGEVLSQMITSAGSSAAPWM